MSLPSAARANGRFPRAERLIEDPRDAGHLLLAATYGILTTHDRGRSWSYICERSFSGVDMYVGDPLIDLAGDGTLVVGVQVGINVSRDLGCSWPTAFGGPGRYVPDFAVARDAAASIVAAYASSEEGGVVVRLVESTDGASTFHPLGSAVPVGVAFTVDVAPSDANIIYVSGLSRANLPILVGSVDRGATWTSRDIASGADELPYIAAVDPADAQKVYVRTSATSSESGVSTASDALFVTADSGQSWREVFRAPAQALGFALSPDGATVLLGYGDNRDGDVFVDSSAVGVYRSGTRDFAFERLSTASTTCLAWTKTGVYVCTSPFETGYSVAFAPAGVVTAASGVASGGLAAALAPLLAQGAVQGPLGCCGGASVCAASWQTTCLVLGSCDAGAPDDAACVADDAASSAREAGMVHVDASAGPRGCSCRVGHRPRRTGHDAGCVAGLFSVGLWAMRGARRPWRWRLRESKVRSRT